MKKRVKGKRYKKKKKRIAKKRIFLLIFILIILLFFISQRKKNEEQKSEQIEETIVEIQKEEIIIKPSEDIEIKELIQQEQEKYNLDETNFAFFYYRIEDKKYYFYNQDKTFTAGSTVKVPVAMLYYEKINSGELTLDSTLVYSEETYEEGGGTTASTYKVKEKIPISFLLEQSIVNSDNTAVNILIKNLGKNAQGQKQYRYDITKYTDEKEKLPEEFYNNNLTTASFSYHVIDYLYQNQTQYTELIEYMKQSSSKLYLKKYISEYEVAHKYGSYDGYVHDYGFVLVDQPYLIGIFTKNVLEADEVIAQISLDVLNQTEKKN